eukprot:c244_g1_i1.p1 GENE.c244_g1_i1~~c244_g1_i1.p1  ORF type:complete len:268 (-),score=90.36 c244_g1_i1:410-1213(-)
MMIPEKDVYHPHLFQDSPATRSAMLNIFEKDHDWKTVLGPLGVRLPGGEKKVSFILENVFSPIEANQMIFAAEKVGFSAANDSRSISSFSCDDTQITNLIWKRIRPYVPRCWHSGEALGLSSRFQIIRYDVTDDPITHGNINTDSRKMTKLSVFICLNDEYQGGQIRFLDQVFHDHVDVDSKLGRTLVFEHGIRYQINPIASGRKYLLRMEVLYSLPSIKGKFLEYISADGPPGPRDGFIETDLIGYAVIAFILTFLLIALINIIGF